MVLPVGLNAIENRLVGFVESHGAIDLATYAA